ncbi:MAG TPA: DNA (cytosine-5-)-methyltransferase [Flavobacteriaceae bacterium]|nr:DNA (cytosine-5-)-methyltransferase [Flavobacteriaceae bacterium]
MKMLDLFSGIGGFSLAAKWAGIDTVAFCEKETYCQKILRNNFPSIPVFPDICELKGDDINGTIDIITGGFPCQPFSIAGRKKGTEDDRDLWPQMFRIIQEFKPTWVVGENVANFVNMAFRRTKTDLESEGYEVQPLIIPACGVGAPHRRDRAFIIAHKKSSSIPHPQKIRRYRSKIQNNRRYKPKNKQSRDQGRSQVERHIWQSEPCMDRVVNGVPNRLDRIKGLGNAIVPQVAYQILKGIKEVNK